MFYLQPIPGKKFVFFSNWKHHQLQNEEAHLKKTHQKYKILEKISVGKNLARPDRRKYFEVLFEAGGEAKEEWKCLSPC